MFKPLRFNNLLKAVPGLSHLQLTPQAAHKKAQVHEHIETENIHAANGAVKRTRVKEDIEEDVHVKQDKEFLTTEVHKRITEDIRVKQVERKGNGAPSEVTISRVHATTFEVAQIEMTP